MANRKVRHLIERVGGGVSRFYWQPSSELRAEGWKPRLLTDVAGAPLREWTSAAAAAELLNAEVDAWRRGELAPNAPPAARARAKAPPPNTVAALVKEYQDSRFWTALKPATQRSYKWCLDLIEAWAGDLPVRAVTSPAVQAFYESQLRRVEGVGRRRKVIETPAKAAAAVRVLRLLLQVGVRLGYCPTNAAEKPGIGFRRAREPVLWSPQAVWHMAAAADTLGWRSVGTAILLNEWLGQREGDLLRLPTWKAEAGALVFQQRKGGRWVSLPLHLVPHLVDRLKAEAVRPGAVASLTHLLLHEGTKQEWNEHTFRHVFAVVRTLAAETMPECAMLRFMELRHTAVTRLHEAEVDTAGIASITGHSPKTVQEMLDRHYLIRTAKAAEGAFRRRLAAEKNEGGT